MLPHCSQQSFCSKKICVSLFWLFLSFAACLHWKKAFNSPSVHKSTPTSFSSLWVTSLFISCGKWNLLHHTQLNTVCFRNQAQRTNISMWFCIWGGSGSKTWTPADSHPLSPMLCSCCASKNPQGSEETLGPGLAQRRQELDWMQLTWEVHRCGAPGKEKVGKTTTAPWANYDVNSS